MTDRIVTLHHLPASGGTIVSKVLAAMQGVMLLSEVHPDRQYWSQYNPLVQLSRGYADLLGPAERAAMDDLFANDIGFALDVARRNGMALVVRDHSAIDFLFTSRGKSRLVDVLSSRWTVQPLVSLRDPVDVWISCSLQGWLGPMTPDELCLRYMTMLAYFSDHTMFLYETFAAQPATVMRDVCARAGLPFSADFMERLDQVSHMTGDSGRSSNVIGLRPRQWDRLSKDAIEGFIRSTNYRRLTDLLGYTHLSDLDEAAARLTT